MAEITKFEDEIRKFYCGSAEYLAPDPSSNTFTLHGDTDHYLRDRPVDVSHIKISCRFDIERSRVIGDVHLDLIAVVDGVSGVSLDCEDTKVESVKRDGTELLFTHIGDVLEVHLPAPVSKGDSIKISVSYVSTPRRGLYFTGPDENYPDKPVQIWTQGQDTDNHHWFPCIDEPKGRITSEIVCTVPYEWSVISNGRLVSSEADEQLKERTFHWLQDKPHAVYLITLVAGKFSRIVLQDSGPYIDFYCEPGREDDARRSFGNTPAMIRFFEEVTGEPYPWDKYTQVAVQDFIFGGMENTSATTQTDLTLHDEKAHRDFSSDFLVSHEAAHQWFGDLITCYEWPHGWLNEGFATFFEALWEEHHRGRDEYLLTINDLEQGYLAEKYQRPIVQRRYSNHTDIFDRHLYDKAGMVLHMLRRELGDTLFFGSIRLYVQRNKGRNVRSIDFQSAIEEFTGRSMDWFFEQWLYRSGHPAFQVSYSWEGNDNGKDGKALLSVRQTQDEPFRCSLEILVDTLSDGLYRQKVLIDRKEQTITINLPEKPVGIVFDALHSVVKTLEFKPPRSMLIHQIQRGEDGEARMAAARSLGNETGADVVEVLSKAMNEDSFWGVQAAAARALGDVHTPSARDALIAAIRIPHLKVRRAVAQALGRYRYDEKAAAALEEMVADPDSYYVVSAACAAFGATRLERSFNTLVKALDKDSHLETIRAGALAGLACMPTEASRDIALKWTEAGKPQRARAAAVKALGMLGENHKPSIDLLTHLLDDDWFQIRIVAIDSLRRLHARDAIPSLNRLVSRDLDARVVRIAREAIRAIQKGTVIPEELRSIRDRLEKMENENRSLRDKVDKLEDRIYKSSLIK